MTSRTICRIRSGWTRRPTSSSGILMPKVRRLAANVATAQVCASRSTVAIEVAYSTSLPTRTYLPTYLLTCLPTYLLPP